MKLKAIAVDYISKLLIKISNNVNIGNVTYIERYRQEFVKYMSSAGTLIIDVADACTRYHCRNSYLDILFLHFYIGYKGFIPLYPDTTPFIISHIIKMDNNELLLNLNCLHFYNLWSENITEDKLSSFFKKMYGIQIVVMDEGTNDTVIQYIVQYIPNLKVLNFEEDSCSVVSSKGLEALKACRKLEVVLFSSTADEYDQQEDKCVFSPEVVAALLISLPNLKHFKCSVHILRDALNIVYKNGDRLSKMTCLCLDNLEANTTSIASALEVCPNVQELHAAPQGQEEIFSDILRERATRVNTLYINKCIVSIQKLSFVEFGHYLVVLHVKTSVFTVDDLLYLSKYCPNLENLGISDQPHEGNIIEQRWNTACTSHITINMRLRSVYHRLATQESLIYFMQMARELEYLHCKGCFSQDNLTSWFESLEPNTYLSKIKRLVIPYFECSNQTIIHILQVLRDLEYVNMLFCDFAFVSSYVYSHNFKTRLEME